MNVLQHLRSEELRHVTRRHFLRDCTTGLGGMWMASQAMAAGGSMPRHDPSNPLAAIPPTFAPKAKRVIYLSQHGGPSQMDIFDYKPGLAEQFDKELPKSVRGDQRITGMTSGQSRLPVAPSIFKFKKYDNNQDGLWVSELYPYTGGIANELCVVK